MTTIQERRSVRRLARLPYHRISAGEPDIRGWLVIGADGRRIGRVRDLLIDLNSLRTRYIEVKLDVGIAAAAGGPTAVLPVECLRSAVVRPYLHVLGVEANDFVDLPGFGTPPTDGDEDVQLRRFFRCLDCETGPDDFWRPRRRERASLPYVSSTRAG
ncbi:MAG: PRC-barrel domain-containing protein [Gemmatimonadaceae bacterium]